MVPFSIIFVGEFCVTIYNFWTPVTGKMGDGWAYRYDAHQIRGFKQTCRP